MGVSNEEELYVCRVIMRLIRSRRYSERCARSSREADVGSAMSELPRDSQWKLGLLTFARSSGDRCDHIRALAVSRCALR